ncbi:MAG: UDP-glucuronate decarboxylase [uncultured Acidimicrobiales bacterium]|uniref:UDP-glucuronate decarboxylase n=1 Tax=uncultured Acidimicrobiales bacterium TaxID=310071 RepID=A0A6J4IP04_9ACTN|nr:MAG: UDP-glucuronate decarboxylase [uncultured Acidimicrobiales bacterium]
MRALVTGAAGFIGSHLCERLLRDGWDVRGADCFTPHYGRAVKEANVATLRASSRFELAEVDLRLADSAALVAGCDTVFHLAAQPGVRTSWSDGFALHDDANVRVTQRLLEAVAQHPVQRFVYTSSASVYGNDGTEPSRETDLPRPLSPYGVTKLAAEHLCAAYAASFGVPSIALRLFSVYGPRQRPDMALHRMIGAARDRAPFEVFGSGEQVRDLTFVADAVDAVARAGTRPVDGYAVLNVAGGQPTTVVELARLVGRLTGVELALVHLEAHPGDAARTCADLSLARSLLGWSPSTGLEEGVAAQIDS